MKKINYALIGKRLNQARIEKNISLEEAGNKIGVNKSTILRWENGNTEKFKIPLLELLADFYGVNISWLMGYDSDQYIKTDKFGNPVSSIPLLGIVKAGYNYLAQENWIGTINVEQSLVEDGSEYYALKVKGDSMAPVFVEDDIVIVHKQNDCENNEIAIVIINGDEGTIKKIRKTNSGIILQPLNPAYSPVMYSNDEIKSVPVIIAGVVKQLKREF